MFIDKKFKDPQNLKVLIPDEGKMLNTWIDVIPANYRWWFLDNEPYVILKHPMKGEAIYPSGLKYNGEVLLYLLAHGFLQFFKRFFQNLIEMNPGNIPLNDLLENTFDINWFIQDGAYDLNDEMRIYLLDKNFCKIRNMNLEEGNDLYE